MELSSAFTSLLFLFALTTATACGSSEPGAAATGTGGTGTGGTGSGGSGGLLDLPSGAKYDCSVSRVIGRLNLPWNLPWEGFSLVSGAAGVELVAVLDRNRTDPNKPGNIITWSILGLDGKQGPTTAVRAPTNQFLYAVTAASGGEKSTIVWSETEGEVRSSLYSAQVTASGVVVTEASVVSTLVNPAAPKIAKASSGYALLWVEEQPTRTLSFGLLDENGKLASTPIVLLEGQFINPGSIASVGDHFVVSYADYRYDESSRLLFLGSDGNVLGEPVSFADSAGPSGFGSTLPSLLVRGDQLLAAWAVTSFDATGSATTIRVARFDANGELQGSIHDLLAPVKDREFVQPFWVEVGEDLGLLWADGSVIYVCGGCVPNHSLKFVVLDGQDFTPQSDVVTLANTLPSGGLLSPAAVRTGDDLLVVSTVTYHTSGEGASAAIRCVK